MAENLEISYPVQEMQEFATLPTNGTYQDRSDQSARPRDPVSNTAWPYSVEHGRIVFQTAHRSQNGQHEVQSKPIADFCACISEEISEEGGGSTYVVKGRALRGGSFRTEVPAADFSDARKLKGIIEEAAGAHDPVRAGMAQHLGPAIKLLTPNEIVKTRRYRRTGWTQERFLIPGLESPEIKIELHPKLAYNLHSDSELGLGLKALDALLLSIDPKHITVILAHVFGAPLAQQAGWRNERCALMIAGRTGSLKTSVAKAAMSLYGPAFMHDDLLIKWGEGATTNAMMALATQAHDMPMLIDNFKPSTGGGVNAFVNLVHNVLEGGEKDRLDRRSQLREPAPVFCWPIFTGEDVPDSDPASLARMLVVRFAPKSGQSLDDLTRAQHLSRHLCAVGKEWIQWLASDDGIRVARNAGEWFPERRDEWAGQLRRSNDRAVNVLRVASNLAINGLVWEVLARHPILGDLAHDYCEAHHDGLVAVAEGLAKATTEALEATHFIHGLRQLIAADRVTLIPMGSRTSTDERPNDMIGWYDEDNGDVYLLPDLARRAVERILGSNALGSISNVSLYRQLDELDAIAGKDKGRHTKTIRVGSASRNVLHLRANTFLDEYPG